MLDQYITSTPAPTNQFSDIFAELRLLKTLFAERWELDHILSETTAETDSHRKLTMKAITVDMLSDKMPYPMNWTTGEAEMPNGGTILFVKLVDGIPKLTFANLINNTLTETEIY